MRDLILVAHVVTGTVALVAGPLTLPALLRGDRRGAPMLAYQLALGAVNATAVALALLDFEKLWFLAVIAVAVEGAAIAGWVLAVSQAMRLRLLCGTYVGLVTALLVVSWGGPFAWILPTLVGVPLIERAAAAGLRYSGRFA